MTTPLIISTTVPGFTRELARANGPFSITSSTLRPGPA